MISDEPLKTVGGLIRFWRKERRLSQLQLATDTDVSARHLSFLETGRAMPSRGMLLRLAEALGLPPRELNALLDAAGFAAAHRETPLEAPEMTDALRAVRLLLAHQEPYPAALVDKHYDVRMVNRGWARMPTVFDRPAEPAYELLAPGERNALVAVFDPDQLRPCIVNWTACAPILLDRVARERVRDPALEPLLRKLLDFPDVKLSNDGRSRPGALLIPLVLQLGPRVVSFYSTITTLGTPQDLTLAELHIEVLYPADATNNAAFRALYPPDS